MDFESGYKSSYLTTSAYLSTGSQNFEKTARSGVCPVDCMSEFYMFFIVLCINKFIGGTEGSSNFLLGIRLVKFTTQLRPSCIKFFILDALMSGTEQSLWVYQSH